MNKNQNIQGKCTNIIKLNHISSINESMKFEEDTKYWRYPYYEC